jgi:hypothetical protein
MSALCQKRTSAASFDHIVGEREQPVGNLEAERLRGLEVDGQFELRGLYDRQVGGAFHPRERDPCKVRSVGTPLSGLVRNR